MAPSSGSNLTQCYITLAVRQKPQSPRAPSEHSEHNRKADRQTERQRIAYTRIKFHQNDSPFCVLVLSNLLPHLKLFTTLSFCFLSCNKTVHRTSKSIKKTTFLSQLYNPAAWNPAIQQPRKSKTQRFNNHARSTTPESTRVTASQESWSSSYGELSNKT